MNFKALCMALACMGSSLQALDMLVLNESGIQSLVEVFNEEGVQQGEEFIIPHGADHELQLPLGRYIFRISPLGSVAYFIEHNFDAEHTRVHIVPLEGDNETNE